MTVATILNRTLSSSTNNWNGYTVKVEAKAAGLTVPTGVPVSMTVYVTAGSEGLDFNKLYVGHKVAGGNAWKSSTPVAISTAAVTMAANETRAFTVNFAWDKTSSLIFGISGMTNAAADCINSDTAFGTANCDYHYKGACDDAAIADPSGYYSAGTGRLLLISRIDIEVQAEQSEPLHWPNNVNAILQKDSRGVEQNHIFYDNDDGFQVGPKSASCYLTGYMQVPFNLFRPHIVSDFTEVNLDPKWTFTPTGTGSLTPHNGRADIATGAISGGGGRLTMPNVPAFLVPGMKVYFYFEVPDGTGGGIDLKFGVAGGSEYARFSRIDAGNYRAQTNISGASDTDTGQAGDYVRRLFIIHFNTNGKVDYWISTTGGNAQLLASHDAVDNTTEGNVFVEFYSRSNSNRNLLLDVVYAILVR